MALTPDLATKYLKQIQAQMPRGSGSTTDREFETYGQSIAPVSGELGSVGERAAWANQANMANQPQGTGIPTGTDVMRSEELNKKFGNRYQQELQKLMQQGMQPTGSGSTIPRTMAEFRRSAKDAIGEPNTAGMDPLYEIPEGQVAPQRRSGATNLIDFLSGLGEKITSLVRTNEAMLADRPTAEQQALLDQQMALPGRGELPLTQDFSGAERARPTGQLGPYVKGETQMPWSPDERLPYSPSNRPIRSTEGGRRGNLPW
jgi:hypothetical protein|tara:strand:- start:3615 stop:4394 length:780 start_codon:yes stop_codon:yes gene_type:complete